MSHHRRPRAAAATSQWQGVSHPACARRGVWTASGSTDHIDRVHAMVLCIPDPVFGSCAVAASDDCYFCFSTVLLRDITLGGDDAAQEAAVIAACGRPPCTGVANADAATLSCTDATDSQVTACLAGFSLCESGGTETCANSGTYMTQPDASADLCVRVPTVVAGSCADFDALVTADIIATSPTACTSVPGRQTPSASAEAAFSLLRATTTRPPRPAAPAS
jgi:hypothetical protein